MSQRSDMCGKSIQEVAWEHVSLPSDRSSGQHRRQMVGEFGEDAVKNAIQAADDLRQLMGLNRRYMSRYLVDGRIKRSKEIDDACTD